MPEINTFKIHSEKGRLIKPYYAQLEEAKAEYNDLLPAGCHKSRLDWLLKIGMLRHYIHQEKTDPQKR